MFFRKLLRFSAVFLLLSAALIASAHAFGAQERRGRKYKAPPPTMKIDIEVVRDSSGKPIPNAAVIFHPVNEKGKEEGALELKTDPDGKASLDVIPVGSTVRLQIIANGFQTFGNDYVANADAKSIVIRMKRPGEQYSIYKGNGTGDQSGQADVKTEKPAGGDKPQ